jgi:hypothetical protein
MINFFVGKVTIIAFGFIALWLLRPSFRLWIEQPKYKLLENERRFRLQKKEDAPRFGKSI